MGVKEKGEIYRCMICGNEIKVLYVGGGTLTCCNKPMELTKEGEPEEDEEPEEAEEEENWGGFEKEPDGPKEGEIEEDMNKSFAG